MDKRQPARLGTSLPIKMGITRPWATIDHPEVCGGTCRGTDRAATGHVLQPFIRWFRENDFSSLKSEGHAQEMTTGGRAEDRSHVHVVFRLNFGPLSK